MARRKHETMATDLGEPVRDPAGALARLRAASARYDAARAAHATATRDAQGYRVSLAAQYRQARTLVEVHEAEDALRAARAEALAAGAGAPEETRGASFGAEDLADELAPWAARRVAAEREIATCDAAAAEALEAVRVRRRAVASSSDRDPVLGPPTEVPSTVYDVLLTYERTGGRPDPRTLMRMTVGGAGEPPRGMTPEAIRACAIAGRWPGSNDLPERIRGARRALADVERRAGEEVERARRDAERDAALRAGAEARDAAAAAAATKRAARDAAEREREEREAARLRELGRASLGGAS